MLLADSGLGTNAEVGRGGLSMPVADHFAESSCTLLLGEVLAVTCLAMPSAEVGLVGGFKGSGWGRGRVTASGGRLAQSCPRCRSCSGYLALALSSRPVAGLVSMPYADAGQDPYTELVTEALTVG